MALERPETHPFFVRLNHENHGHAVEAQTALDAALIFIERWHAGMDDGDASLVVMDAVTGERHCLNIDLGSGTAAPCPQPRQ